MAKYGTVLDEAFHTYCTERWQNHLTNIGVHGFSRFQSSYNLVGQNNLHQVVFDPAFRDYRLDLISFFRWVFREEL